MQKGLELGLGWQSELVVFTFITAGSKFHTESKTPVHAVVSLGGGWAGADRPG